tara:strand:- start:4703 stop:6001 length:1299 start_codon:yes stop_codon:yes gene_type:complete
MGGGLLQLVSSGKQGKYLTSNPQISYFKQVHKKHTNFAIESIPLQFNQTVDFGLKSVCKVGRHGDLLNKCFLEISLPNFPENISAEKDISEEGKTAEEIQELEEGKIAWTNGIGNALIKEVQLLIGGEIIDRMDGQLLDIYSEFYLEEGKRNTYHKLIGYHKSYDGVNDNDKAMRLYVPLEFWFCRNIGSSLPLVSMQYHDVEIQVEFRKFSECYYQSSEIPTPVSITSCRLYADYVYLDIDERKEFASRSHEYLITQHQKNDNNSIQYSQKSVKIDLEFNHPVKSLFWFVKTLTSDNDNLWFDYYPRLAVEPTEPLKKDELNFIDSVQLLLNGQERFNRRNGEFFRYIEPYKRCRNVPDDKSVYNYNFGVNTCQFQPSGFLNFSRIDNSQLNIDIIDDNTVQDDTLYITIYAINYNVLKIHSGMGGLMYKD